MQIYNQTYLPGETKGRSKIITTPISTYINDATKVHCSAMSGKQ